MSGRAANLTFACDSTRCAAMLAGLPDDDLSAIDDLAEDEFLSAGSRNNRLEWSLNHLIREWHLPGLQHLQKGFDVVDGEVRDGDWWVTWLAPADVPPTIAALDALLERVHAQPQQLLALLSEGGLQLYGCEPDELRDLAGSTPASWAEAAAAYQAHWGDNDGVLELVIFVQAHRAMLDTARERGEGAMYMSWLY